MMELQILVFISFLEGVPTFLEMGFVNGFRCNDEILNIFVMMISIFIITIRHSVQCAV